MLRAGARLGPYEVSGQIGAGGMGEVYRATDVVLGREVAIKVLPEPFANDPERIARFEREAKSLAALNHPNIAIIHGVETVAGVRALVLELVEGPTLANRIEQGPLTLDDALSIADQVAQALHAAHDAGIVHRDLKPANIKVRADGTVKVLDFGLAKMAEQTGGHRPGSAVAPTITTPAMTAIGVILGTAAYMSPEQARGIPADKRSDIWAFGCVLFEMLTGHRAFASRDETVSDVVAAVLKTEPAWSALPAATPSAVMRLLRRCLAKDPRTRLHDIADARLDIVEAARAEPAAAAPAATASRLAWAITAALAVACVVLAFLLYRTLVRSAIDLPVFRSMIPSPAVDPSAATTEARTGMPRFARGVAISPDGTTLAFVAPGNDGRVALWVRPLDGLEARLLAGTEGAGSPFWSPNGRRLGFVADRRLKIVSASGGPVTTLFDGARQFATGTWNRDDSILFDTEDRILRVAASGGAAAPVIAGQEAYTAPYFLPDGRHFLYSVATSGASTGGVLVGSLDGTAPVRLRDDGFLAAYANRCLLFVRDGTLFAQSFDPDRLTLSGDARPIAERVEVGGAPTSSATYAVSTTGVLVYQAAFTERSELAWFTRDGKNTGVLSDVRDFGYLQLSHDDRRVAVSRMDEGSRNRDVWLYDTLRQAPSRLTYDPSDDFAAVWSSNGDRLVFAGHRQGDRALNLYVTSASGARDERRLLEREGLEIPTSWSLDGQFLLFQSEAPASDVFVLNLRDSEVTPFLDTRFAESSAQFSPDGRWVAYTSNQSGRTEVYVAPFRRPGQVVTISTDGGGSPRWRHDGRELFYIGRDNMLMAATVRPTESSIEVSDTVSLFRASFRPTALPYAVTSDGRFLVIRSIDEPTRAINLVVNWPSLLNK